MLSEYIPLLVQGTLETLYMTLVSTALAYVFGLPLGVTLVVSRPGGILPHPKLKAVLDTIVNLTRSLPFIILLVAIIPFTRLIVGTSIGSTATIVPLVIAATPFIGRLVESSLIEIDGGIIEAAQSMGARPLQMIWNVMLPEALPSLITGASIAVTTILGYSAMAGIVGGGGLGDIAIRYGVHQYKLDVMLATIVLLVGIVQLLQWIGTRIAKKVDKRVR